MDTKHLETLFGKHSEYQLHGHVTEERALFYSAIDGCSTEYETLNFLHALVYSWKPPVAIETGSFLGFGTIAIASAMQANGFGKLYSIELDADNYAQAQDNVEAFDPDLLSYVEFINGDSLEFIANHTAGKFSFAFLDSETWLRHQEFTALVDRGLLAMGSPCLFHDTSRHRAENANDNADLIEALDKIDCQSRLEFPYSRGFRLVVV